MKTTPMHPLRLLGAVLLTMTFCAVTGCDNNTAAPGDTKTAPSDKKVDPTKTDGKGDAKKDAKADKAEKVTLTLYSGRKDKLVAPILKNFEEDTGIKLRIKYGGTQDLAAAVLKEGARSPADVFLAQDASTLAFLEAKDVFSPLPETILNSVEATNRSTKGMWIGTSGRARVLVYNTNKVKPEELPMTVGELANERWKGRVGWAPENASFKSFVAAMIQLQGPEKTQAWLKSIKANDPKAYPKNTPAVRATARGEVDVALVNHYYLFRIQDEEGGKIPVKNHYFRNGSAESLVNLAGAGVLKSSKHSKAAQQLVAYLTSPKAQEYFAQKVHEFPVNPKVKPSDKLPAIGSLHAPKLDVAKMDNLEATEKLLGTAGVLP